jgi:hypothetical protein
MVRPYSGVNADGTDDTNDLQIEIVPAEDKCSPLIEGLRHLQNYTKFHVSDRGGNGGFWSGSAVATFLLDV